VSFTIPAYDELLNAILTDYINQFPSADTSKGSLIYIKSAAIASAFWGIYQHQRWIADQIFPDTADTEALEHHCYIRGITRKSDETDAALLARLLDYIRRPPAGGNKYDYVKWALAVDNVAAAWCIPLAQGPGSVDVLILANASATGSEIPAQALLDTVRAYIADICPTSVNTLRILAPTVVTQNVTMTCPGVSSTTELQTAITSYMAALEPGQTLYLSQLIALAMSMGATDATITTPAANVTATAWQMVRPGVISVA